MSFPINLHLRLRWQYISRLQFKARGPDFHAELIPVHSPLLRESCLVSYPPLTYMLKFSGFADLTSSQGKAIRSGDKVGSKIHAAAQQVASRWILLVARVRNTSMHCMRQRPDTRRCNAQTRSSHETTRGGACGWHEMMMRLKQACFQGYPESAVCVQIPIGSRSSAIHNAYHTSLRPSSLFEPRHPSLKVVWKLWHKASKEKTPHVDTTWFEHGLAASQPRVAPRCCPRASRAAPWDAQTMDQAMFNLPPPRCPVENREKHTILTREFHISKFT